MQTVSTCVTLPKHAQVRSPRPSCLLGRRGNRAVLDRGSCAATHPMQLHVEATGVAHRFALRVAPPEGCGGSVAVGAAEA